METTVLSTTPIVIVQKVLVYLIESTAEGGIIIYYIELFFINK